MAGEEAPAGTRAGLGPERLLAFSDGVVAIALTLLVLPLVELVPGAEGLHGSGSSIITDNLAPIGSFALSFAVIARFWSAHHRVFDDAPRVGRLVVAINTFWLFTIAVMPFPTEMVGVLSDDPFTLRFYVGTLFASSALLTVMSVLVLRSRPAADETVLRRTGWGGTALLFLVVLVVTFVAPGLGYWPLLLLLATAPVEHLLRPVVGRWILRGDG